MSLTRWLIYQSDFVYPNKHPFVTMSEDAAKHKVASVLRNFTTDSLNHQILVWGTIGPKQDNEHAQFVKDAKKLVKNMGADLDDDKVWTAYRRLKEFEKKYENEFEGFGIMGAIGSLVVVPEPEPE